MIPKRPLLVSIALALLLSLTLAVVSPGWAATNLRHPKSPVVATFSDDAVAVLWAGGGEYLLVMDSDGSTNRNKTLPLGTGFWVSSMIPISNDSAAFVSDSSPDFFVISLSGDVLVEAEDVVPLVHDPSRRLSPYVGPSMETLSSTEVAIVWLDNRFGNETADEFDLRDLMFGVLSDRGTLMRGPLRLTEATNAFYAGEGEEPHLSLGPTGNLTAIWTTHGGNLSYLRFQPDGTEILRAPINTGTDFSIARKVVPLQDNEAIVFGENHTPTPGRIVFDEDETPIWRIPLTGIETVDNAFAIRVTSAGTTVWLADLGSHIIEQALPLTGNRTAVVTQSLDPAGHYYALYDEAMNALVPPVRIGGLLERREIHATVDSQDNVHIVGYWIDTQVIHAGRYETTCDYYTVVYSKVDPNGTVLIRERTIDTDLPYDPSCGAWVRNSALFESLLILSPLLVGVILVVAAIASKRKKAFHPVPGTGEEAPLCPQCGRPMSPGPTGWYCTTCEPGPPQSPQG